MKDRKGNILKINDVVQCYNIWGLPTYKQVVLGFTNCGIETEIYSHIGCNAVEKQGQTPPRKPSRGAESTDQENQKLKVT